MGSEIARDEMRAARRQEYLVLMDDYGAELHFTVPVTWTKEQRAAEIAKRTAAHNVGQAQVESFAAAVGIDLSAQRQQGQAKRAAMQKKYGVAQVQP